MKQAVEMRSAKVGKSGWRERLEIGDIDLDGHTLHDEIEREHQSRTVLVTQHNALHARQRTTADSGFFADRQKRVRRGMVHV